MDLAKFTNQSGYITYTRADGSQAFVARFKYQRNAGAGFIKFIAKHFTEEEYFAALEKAAPLTVAESKGYMLPHIKKLLKAEGYPVTQAGFKQYIQDGIAKRAAAN